MGCQFEIGLQLCFGQLAVGTLFRFLQAVDRSVCQHLTSGRQKDFFVVAGAGNRNQFHKTVFHEAVDGRVDRLLGGKILAAQILLGQHLVGFRDVIQDPHSRVRKTKTDGDIVVERILCFHLLLDLLNEIGCVHSTLLGMKKEYGYGLLRIIVRKRTLVNGIYKTKSILNMLDKS